jgi:thioredoxin-related protein
MKRINLLLIALAAIVALMHFPAPISAAENGMQWLTYQQGVEQQRKLKKPMLLFFHLKYCHRCKEMERKIYKDSKIVNFINDHFIPVMVDMGKEKQTTELFEVDYRPTHIFIAPDGSTVLREEDVIKKSRFIRMLEYVAEEKYKSMNFDAYEKSRS